MHKYFEKLHTAIEKLESSDIEMFCHAVELTYSRSKQIFICGNGGSAALASHIAIGLTKSARDMRAISLTDTATITAWANDIAYSEVFAGQLYQLCRPDDLVIGVSASGQSANIIRAMEEALDRGGNIFVLTGNAGEIGPKTLHDFAQAFNGIIVDSDDYGIVEDIHTSLMHLMCGYMKDKYR